MDNNTVTKDDVRHYLRPVQFVAKYEVGTLGSLRWQIHHASTNGLEQSGAVVRVHARPGGRRPMVFIDVDKYFAWLRRHGAANSDVKEPPTKRRNARH